MKWIRIGALLAGLASLSGCIKVKDHLTLQSDGSGTVRIETQHSPLGAELGSMDFVGGAPCYPPVNEAEAMVFFPAKDFTVKTTQERADNGDVITVIEAAFTNLNALLASVYGEAHQLTARVADGVLEVKAVSGLEAAARLAEIKSDSARDNMGMPGLADLQKRTSEMRDEFILTLPNNVTEANGVKEGKSATWVVERSACADAEDFAKRLRIVVEARCAAEGLAMSPVTPPRLSLLSFDNLAAGASATAGSGPDTNAIAAAAKFVPYGIVVSRALDLSGQGGGEQNSAKLFGCVVMPQAYAPQAWGKATLDEVVDANGLDLKLDESSDRGGYDMFSSPFGRPNNGGDDGTEGAPDELRHDVGFSFVPPAWSVNEIARIRGAVALNYFGQSQVVKLTNAVPANWIANGRNDVSSYSYDWSGRKFSDPKLSELGVVIGLQMGMIENGMTILMLQVEGDGVSVMDVCVFDSEGTPWPTFTRKQIVGDDTSRQIMVAGQPKPPFSLALLASSGISEVRVPFELENVRIIDE